MKILKIHLIEVAAAILFVVLVFVFYSGNGDEGIGDMSYNRNWTIVGDGENREYRTLPEAVSLSNGEKEITIRKELPEEFGFANSIGFYTSHQLLEIYVDGEKVFERKIPEGANSKTPGNCWNFVRFSEKDAGKVLEMHIRNCYGSSNVKMPTFYFGSESVIILSQIKDNFLSLVISFIMFTMGMVLVGFWFVVGKKIYFHKGVPWLGLFSVHFAIWSACETQIPLLMFGKPLLFSQITFISLKLMLLPFIYFIRSICDRKNGRILNIFAVTCVIEFAACFIAQLFGWFDLRETIWITHVVGICAVLTVLVIGIQMLLGNKRAAGKRDKKFWLNVVCVCIIGVCVLLDATNYYFDFYSDVAFFSRIGCLIYIFILSKQFIDESMKLIQAGRHAEAILEEAERDGLTCLKNRRSFETDLQNIPKGEFPRYSVAMFDLNNLKLMNDRYGHGVGDYYIINGSEMIRDVFGDMGEIYRIGGDEFCLISDVMTEDIFEQKYKTMCDRLGSLQGAYVKEIMQIASGFAQYSRNVDLNLQDTIGRADERMYRCKRGQKAMRNNSETA